MSTEKKSNEEKGNGVLADVNGSCLVELKRKIHQTAGHTFAAYGSFYSGNMTMAKDFSDKSKASFDELINDIEKLIGNCR